MLVADLIMSSISQKNLNYNKNWYIIFNKKYKYKNYQKPDLRSLDKYNS